MQIIDGYGGRPHIEAFEVRDLNVSLHGPGDYVVDIGDKMACEVITNNKIQIKSGAVLMQGCRGINPVGSLVDMIIENGKTGDNRNDLIVIRYSKDPVSAEESMELAVVKGTAVTGGTAADPDVVTGSLRNGDTLHEMRLYRVALQGLSIVKVTPLFQTIRSTEQLGGLLDDVNTKVGPLASLTTGVKTSIVNAINWLKTQVTNTQNTLEARTNGKAKIWEDAEGGNVQVESPGGVKWQMDAYNGSFRAYASENGTIKPIFTFQRTDAGGDVLTSSKIIDSLSDVAANATAKKIAGALAVKSLNALVSGTRTYSSTSTIIGAYGSAAVRRKVWIVSMSNFTEPASGIQTININSGVLFGAIFRLQAFAKRSSGNVYLLPYTANTDQFGTWLQSTDRQSGGDRFIFKNRLNWGSEYNLYIIAEYTQTDGK